MYSCINNSQPNLNIKEFEAPNSLSSINDELSSLLSKIAEANIVKGDSPVEFEFAFLGPDRVNYVKVTRQKKYKTYWTASYFHQMLDQIILNPDENVESIILTQGNDDWEMIGTGKNKICFMKCSKSNISPVSG